MKSKLEQAIHHATHLLPAQGPIGVFIHHNTLHAFEEDTFDVAVRRGAEVFGCEPYLTEDRYRYELERGRIRFSELRATLVGELGIRAEEAILGKCNRLELQLAMLQYALKESSGIDLDWIMAETDALYHTRPDVSQVARKHLITETRHWVMRSLRPSIALHRPTWADAMLSQFDVASIEKWSESHWEAFTLSALWQTCCEAVGLVKKECLSPPPLVRHRDFLVQVTECDTDLLVHEPLIRFCASFLDQGLAHWDLPKREQGFLASFSAFYSSEGLCSAHWMKGLAAELLRMQQNSIDALNSVHMSLEDLGVPSEEWGNYLADTLLALRGWAGMIWHIEQRQDRVHRGIPSGSLVEFLAVRLLLERFALKYVARTTIGFTQPLCNLRSALSQSIPSHTSTLVEQRAFMVFQIAQILGWTPEQLHHQTPETWDFLIQEIEGFGSLDRRRIFHRAYEMRFQIQTLDALSQPRTLMTSLPRNPRFQAIFCIDEREESIRRHVEESVPGSETFGAAGFFGVVMYYRGVGEVDFVPLCPVVVRPQHWLVEEVDNSHQKIHERRTKTHRLLGRLFHRLSRGSKSPILGALISIGLGVFATAPLVARVLFPRLTARLRGYMQQFVEPPCATSMTFERRSESPSSSGEGLGYALEEMNQIAEKLLRDIGLTDCFAPLVFVFGHGSTSMNNPHESAHDCGACGGGRGGPNARVVALILNDPRVRQYLGTQGIEISENTTFIGGMHNTSTDTLTYYDLDRVPPSHNDALAQAQEQLEEAAMRNAHERARRFESAPLAMSPDNARKHVEGRAEDLSQVRPEWGHATNAICIVGRRQRSRGLYLDRRSFLVSYDPTQDDIELTILSRILQAVFPVCSGINLEYYFSHVDSAGWGSGSKLPHNITSLLGVMDGALSDLRTGLPWQMVEIHEPMRLLFVIEATPETLLYILNKYPSIGNLVRKQWVCLAALSPFSEQLYFFENGAFVLYQPQNLLAPSVMSSCEWYTGWRDHLEFAEVMPTGESDA